MTELAKIENPAELMRQATDVASVCKQIVTKTALDIQGRKYVRIEGWASIAATYGCLLSAKDVKRIDGGTSAIGEVRRMSDGALLSTAEGFVGDDEPVWSGGEVERNGSIKKYEARPDYAKRAMAQTRAMSRAARSAFAFVVTLMDAGLETTPAEEVPHGGFQDASTASPEARQAPKSTPKPSSTAGKPQAAQNGEDGEVIESLVKHFEVVENKQHDPKKPTKGKNWKERFGVLFEDDPQCRKFGFFSGTIAEVVLYAYREHVPVKVRVSQTGKYWNVDAAELLQDIPFGDTGEPDVAQIDTEGFP